MTAQYVEGDIVHIRATVVKTLDTTDRVRVALPEGEALWIRPENIVLHEPTLRAGDRVIRFGDTGRNPAIGIIKIIVDDRAWVLWPNGQHHVVEMRLLDRAPQKQPAQMAMSLEAAPSTAPDEAALVEKPKRKVRPYTRKETADRRARVLALHNTGMSREEIAKALSLSRVDVRNDLNRAAKAGVPS
jgi:hypothetical protein